MKLVNPDTLTDSEQLGIADGVQEFFLYCEPGLRNRMLTEKHFRDADGVLVEVHLNWVDLPGRRVGKLLRNENGSYRLEVP